MLPCSPFGCHPPLVMPSDGIGAVCDETHEKLSIPNAAISHSRVSSNTFVVVAVYATLTGRELGYGACNHASTTYLIFFDAARSAPWPRHDHRQQ